MKNLIFFSLIFGLLVFTSCGDDDTTSSRFDYHAHIDAPTGDTYFQGDTLNISINFEEQDGKKVHNYSVRIYNKEDGSEILNEMDHAHADASFVYEKEFVLHHMMVGGHTDWILEAKVWGDTEGESEEISTHEFHVHPAEAAYHVHIHSPNMDDKHVGDTIMLHFDVEEHTGQTVHHVQARIYNKADGTEFFSGPDDAHVHEEDGTYEMMKMLTLDVAEHTDWVVEVKAWGHEAGDAEVIETVEFHVHP